MASRIYCALSFSSSEIPLFCQPESPTQGTDLQKPLHIITNHKNMYEYSNTINVYDHEYVHCTHRRSSIKFLLMDKFVFDLFVLLILFYDTHLFLEIIDKESFLFYLDNDLFFLKKILFLFHK